MASSHRQNTMPNPQTDSPLFKLPAELRSMIYEYTLFVIGPLGRVAIRKRPEPNDEPSSVLALIQTCRQVRNESEDIFFKINNLATPCESLPRLVREVGRPRLDNITTLEIMMLDGDEKIAAAFRALPRLRNLKCVVVRCLRGIALLKEHREMLFVKQALDRCVELETIKVEGNLWPPVPRRLKEVEEELQYAIDRKNLRQWAARPDGFRVRVADS